MNNQGTFPLYVHWDGIRAAGIHVETPNCVKGINDLLAEIPEGDSVRIEFYNAGTDNPQTWEFPRGSDDMEKAIIGALPVKTHG